MFALTHYERKIIIIIGALLLGGAILRVSHLKFFKEERVEVAYHNQLHKLNINKASLEELITLPYIGQELAQRILEYRKKQGKFKSLEELLQIKGIGEKRLNLIKEYITF